MIKPEQLAQLPLQAASIERTYLAVGHSWDGPVRLPLIVVRGAQTGPKVVVAAAQHGDEGYAVLGVQELAKAIDPQQLRGELWLLPCLNPHGYFAGKRNSPLDQQDMNRVHPGNPDGSITQQIADVLHRFVLPGTDLLLDLHGGSPEVGDIAFGRWSDAPGKPSLQDLALRMPLRFLLAPGTRDVPGMWSTSTPGLGVPQMAIEAGSAYQHAQNNAQEWVELVQTALRYLHMVPGNPPPPKNTPLMRTVSNPARYGGVFAAAVGLGQEVNAGQFLGEVRDLSGQVLQTLHSPVAGIVAVMRTGVRVHPAESLVTLATRVEE